MGTVYIGTSGFNYVDWKGRFYPPTLPAREWLHFYAQQFPTVEMNVSFYRPISKKTYERWYEQTPSDFRFAIKGHRLITQLKKLHEVDEAVQQFNEQVSGLKEKLTAVLWQFPANFKLSSNPTEYKSRLAYFLRLLSPTTLHAFEFRDSSWFTPEIKALLDPYRASLVISESSKFPRNELPGDTFAYIRFHGPAALYASKYSQEQLQQWVQKIHRLSQHQDVYCYFNNDLSGHAIEDAIALKELIRTARADT